MARATPPCTVRCVPIPRVTASILAAAIALSACSSSNDTPSTWSPAAPPERDTAVQAVLPTGSYLVEGSLTFDDGTTRTTIDGYVSFGADPDGVDCAAKFTTSELKNGSPVAVETVRAPGGPSWHRYLDGDDRWRDTADWVAPVAMLAFWPAIVVSDGSIGVVPGGGENWLCAIPLMGRFASLDAATDTTATLSLDAAKVQQTVEATHGRWIVAYVDAVGLDGEKRDRAAAALTELGLTSLIFAERMVFTITRQADGTLQIEQRDTKGGSVVTLLFTPTAEREITPPPGVVPFHDQLKTRAAGGDVDDERLDQALEEIEALIAEG